MSVPSTDNSGGDVVFNIFTLPELISHIAGRSIVGVLAQELSIPRSTMERWWKDEDLKRIDQAMIDNASSELLSVVEPVRNGELSYLSSLGGYAYSGLRSNLSDFDCSLRYLHQFELAEYHHRNNVNRWASNWLLQSIHSMELGVFDSRRANETAVEYALRIINESRGKIISDVFFKIMVSLDIDVCRLCFPGYQLAMVFPIAMPELRQGKVAPYWASSDRKLVDYLYSCISKKSYPPEGDDLWECFGGGKLENFYAGKVKRKTLSEDDIHSLCEYWFAYYRDGKVQGNIEAPAVREEMVFIFIMHLAAKVFDFVFDEFHKEFDKDKLESNFIEKYHRAWQSEVSHRGLDVNNGKAWGDSLATRLIRDSIRWR